MKKAMFSQPMAGKTEDEIVATREWAITVLEAQGYEIVNTPFTDDWYSQENMKERGVVQNPSVFFGEISRKHESVPCRILLQRLGTGPWMQDRARGCRSVWT